MTNLVSWLIFSAQMVVAAFAGALIDRLISGSSRFDTNERFRTIVTTAMSFILLGLTLIMNHENWSNSDTSFRMLHPEYPPSFAWAKAFEWIDVVLLGILIALPFMASHKISDAKVKRRYLAASLAMFVIVPLWVIFSLVWSMK
ncbi:MAG TPA: hypothetical protein VFN09_13055 [Rhodanobacteraceae bacterium]|nr:hypothetical protein [Rhodanobacteraceae bacterium]